MNILELNRWDALDINDDHDEALGYPATRVIFDCVNLEPGGHLSYCGYTDRGTRIENIPLEYIRRVLRNGEQVYPMILTNRRNMKKTGVFLTIEKFDEVRSLLSPKLTILKNGLQVTEPGDKQAAWDLIKTFAVENGLPEDSRYGLTAQGELVTS